MALTARPPAPLTPTPPHTPLQVFKLKFLLPYLERLLRLADNKTLRSELTAFPLAVRQAARRGISRAASLVLCRSGSGRGRAWRMQLHLLRAWQWGRLHCLHKCVCLPLPSLERLATVPASPLPPPGPAAPPPCARTRAARRCCLSTAPALCPCSFACSTQRCASAAAGWGARVSTKSGVEAYARASRLLWTAVWRRRSKGVEGFALSGDGGGGSSAVAPAVRSPKLACAARTRARRAGAPGSARAAILNFLAAAEPGELRPLLELFLAPLSAAFVRPPAGGEEEAALGALVALDDPDRHRCDRPASLAVVALHACLRAPCRRLGCEWQAPCPGLRALALSSGCSDVHNWARLLRRAGSSRAPGGAPAWAGSRAPGGWRTSTPPRWAPSRCAGGWASSTLWRTC